MNKEIYKNGLQNVRHLGLLGIMLLGACSTQVSHPLLEEEVNRKATTVDLALPPGAQGQRLAPPAAIAQDPKPTVELPASAPGAKTAEPSSAPPAAAASQPPAAVERTGQGARERSAVDSGASAKPPGGTARTPAKSEVSTPATRLDITVADVRTEAIGNNLEIKTELVRPALLREDRRQAEARFLPTAFARYNLSKLDEPGLPPVRNPNRTITDTAELGLQIPLQTGGNAQISVPLTRTDFDVQGAQNVYDAAATLSLSQPLLRDAGLHVNRAPITVARLQERQQDASTKLAILNVLAASERAYWNLYATSRAVEVRLAQYARAQEQERQATRLAAEGVVPAIEITRARAGVARRIDDIIRAENARRQGEREVKRAMNRPDLPVSGATALIVTTAPDPVEIVVDRAAALTEAQKNRMELLNLELQLAVDSLTVDVTRNQKLPKLALDYSFRYLGAAFQLDDALDMVGREDFNDQSIGLTLEVPLGNQARQSRYNRAVYQRALTLSSREQQAQLIDRQVLDTIDQLDEAWQRILAAREETLLAARNYQAEQRQFIAGVRTSTDVLISADFLADAQIRELNALSAYEIAKIDLAFVTGTLLGTGRIELKSFDETDDVDTVAERDVKSLAAEAPARPKPAQESISQKLGRLGVKAPDASQDPLKPVLKRPPTPAPTPAPTPTPTAQPSGTIGPVTATDTLWSLARTHRPDPGIPVSRMVAALMRANPEQFPTSDPTRLVRGAMLKLPNAEQLANP